MKGQALIQIEQIKLAIEQNKELIDQYGGNADSCNEYARAAKEKADGISQFDAKYDPVVKAKLYVEAEDAKLTALNFKNEIEKLELKNQELQSEMDKIIKQ